LTKQETQPTTLERWTAIGVVVNAIAVIAVAAAGFIAYLQFRSSVGQESVKRTIEFLMLSYAERVGPAQQRLWSELLASKTEIINQVSSNKASLDPKQRSAAFHELMASFVSAKKLERDINQVYSFYDQIAVCVNAGICDYTSAKVFFQNDMEDFTSWFEPYLEDNAREIGRTYRESNFYKLLTRMRTGEIARETRGRRYATGRRVGGPFISSPQKPPSPLAGPGK
jgi:hypothetical protein